MATIPPLTEVRPKLRPYLEAVADGDEVILRDPRRVGAGLTMSRLGFEIVARLNGTHTLAEMQIELLPLTGGAIVPLDVLERLVAALDEALLLDSPRLQAYFDLPIRKPSHVGCYSTDPDETRAMLTTTLFSASGGPGMPREGPPKTTDRLRAVLLPHMDYGRGNVTYGFGFKELIENSDARVFVIIATSHYSPHRFTLTRQHFDTPLGLVPTDVEYVNRIAAVYGDGVFDDLAAHVPEHSIELEVVPLKFLLGDRPFRIVPLLVGSFRDRIDEKANPAEADDVGKMLRALREAEAACPDPVCYLISGDLAHIGPKFKDRRKAREPWLSESRAKDEEILEALRTADPAKYFETIAAEGDSRRICGLSPTWLTLEATRPRSGKVLHYQQFAAPDGHESVSFAAAAFYG